MALPPGYLGLIAAADALGIELDKEQAIAIEEHLNAHGREIVATWQVDESKRHQGLFLERGFMA